jgi:putative phage-type endonuclease
MSKIYEFIKAPQRSAKWLELRKQGIGASDVAAVLGVSPYKSRLELYLQKRGELDEKPVGAAAQRGVILEDAVAKMYEAERPGTKLRSWHGIIRRKDAPWKYASLDRTIVGTERIVEIKTSSSPRWQLYPVPPEVEAQARWQMIVSGFKHVDIAALLGGLVLRIETIEWDDEKHERIEAEVEQFWRDVQDGVQPDPAPLDADIFDRIYPKDSGETINAEKDSELDELITTLVCSRSAAKDLADIVSETEAKIKDAMREATQLKGSAATISWKATAGRRMIDWEAIARSSLDSGDLDIAIKNNERSSAGARRFVVKEDSND